MGSPSSCESWAVKTYRKLHRQPGPRWAYEIARGVLDQYPTIKKIEVHLVHFSKGLETKEESEDNHVVNLVLQRQAQ
jgi:hypothetical protein